MLKIKEVMKDKGVTVQEIAKKLGISRVALSYQLNGSPRLDTLQKIADALDVNILDLFKDTRPKEKEKFTCPYCGNPLDVDIK
jgi:transcriptional regulator with XRE-family HTH domain